MPNTCECVLTRTVIISTKNGRGFEVDDVIMIGDIIVDANDITAVGFRINPVQIFVGIPEPISDDPINDSEDPETK